MSGTSLDGMDLAYVEFLLHKGKWSYQLIAHKTINYSPEWKGKLSACMHSSALEFIKTHNKFGKYTGDELLTFINENELEPDIIGVHGHTIFHQPQKGYTTQIGDGSIIAAITKQLVACDFRSIDVARGGQGAPLVPIGDQLLYSDYPIRINIGGFANISYENKGKTIAYDIAPANIVLNDLAQKMGNDYDNRGFLARSGKINSSLLQKLQAQNYYSVTPPKSLGKEWVDTQITPLLHSSITPKDLLCTFTHHIALQIAKAIKQSGIEKGEVLLSGGGVFNDFLIEQINENSPLKLHIPPAVEVDMKEAIIFAFLAILRLKNQSNTLMEVTGAKHNSIGGALYNGRIEKV